ncbi:hypothetical protein [Streptosporangium sp. NPDC023615]|uniref:hypothetical protein n=1 Tax=Streptosporangium sp. NPDC023615 TaxID=3154794 RepID=UPI003436EBB5
MVFWSDWVVAGAIAAVVYVLKSVSAGQQLDLGKIAVTLLILVSASLFLPSIIGKILYDVSGQLKSGYMHIALGNAIGLAVLVGSVFGGAQIG